MDAPTPVDFASTDRIQELYATLSMLFAKDILWRQQQGLPANGHTPQTPVNTSLKRDRPDDSGGDTSNKRRDTGESKNPLMPPPAAPSLPSSSPSPRSATKNFPPPAPVVNSSVGGMAQSTQLSSPSMPPPSLPSSTTEAQLAASTRERARQMQIRQAVQQQQQQQQQQQMQQHQMQQQQPQTPQMQQNVRHMSPPAAPSPGQHQQMSGQGMQPNATAGPSSTLNSNASAAVIASLGPHAMQHFQILQNPSHPFVQYMLRNVPGFGQLPLQVQMQRMQSVQACFTIYCYRFKILIDGDTFTAGTTSSQQSAAA
jgi:hypothetical protein